MAIDTIDKVVAALAASPARFNLYKASATSEGAGLFHSLWKLGGSPVAGASPPAYSAGSGYVPTDTTTGSLVFTNPTGGAKTNLLRAALGSSVVGTLILYDRLWACSGFSTTTTTAQNVTTPGSLTRPDPNGVGAELFFEVYAAPGATTATWTISYTNSAGTSGRTATYTHPANAESIGQMMPVLLQAGDTGVQSVQSLTCSVSSGTGGDVGITILRRIAEIPMPVANVVQPLDFAALGMPEIPDDACIGMMVLCSTTTTGNVLGSIKLGQG